MEKFTKEEPLVRREDIVRIGWTPAYLQGSGFYYHKNFDGRSWYTLYYDSDNHIEIVRKLDSCHDCKDIRFSGFIRDTHDLEMVTDLICPSPKIGDIL